MTANASPFDVVDVSLKCRVEEWLHPAYEALCRRGDSFTDDEVERLGLKRAAAIWRIRESLEFETTQEVSTYSCNDTIVSREVQVFKRAVPRKKGKPKYRAVHVAVARARTPSPPGNPEPSVNHVLELIKMEDALKFA